MSIHHLTIDDTRAWFQASDREVFIGDVLDLASSATTRVRFCRYGKGAAHEWMVTYDETLIEPVCQGSLIRIDAAKAGGPPRFLFANPASSKREKLTVRLSTDDCKTWAASRELWPGPAAYSDLAVLPDGTLLCLYERGEKGPYEKITFARFLLEWLTGGKDR